MEKLAKKRLFECAVLLHDEKEGTSLILEPTTFLAVAEKTAAMMVTRMIDPKYDDKLDSIEICIRPF